MHVLLVGPGALGCLLASVLFRGTEGTDTRLSLLDHNPSRADFLNRRGILYDLHDEQRCIPLTVTADPLTLGPVDVLILCVKSYDIPASLTACRHLLQKGPLLLFMQNGIAHLDSGLMTGAAAVAFGTTTEGATLLARGHVRHAGSGATHLGFLARPDDRSVMLLERTAEIFRHGGLLTTITDDIMNRLWAKLFINVGINALTATLACKNGELLTMPGIDERMQTAVDEAMRIARAEGIEVMDDPYWATRIVCSKTAENVSSMLQDVRNRRRTEIDAINGAVVAKGLHYGIKTPENSLLCRQVKEIEAGYLTAITK